MSTLTIRLPDDTHARMKVLARHRPMSVNKLMAELCTIAVTQHDAETRFRALARAVPSTKGCVSSTDSTPPSPPTNSTPLNWAPANR